MSIYIYIYITTGGSASTEGRTTSRSNTGETIAGKIIACRRMQENAKLVETYVGPETPGIYFIFYTPIGSNHAYT